MEHTTSAKITSSSDIVLPMPSGSGNSIARLSKAAHFAMPWLRKGSPIIMRAARRRVEASSGEGVAGKRIFFTFDIAVVFMVNIFIRFKIYFFCQLFIATGFLAIIWCSLRKLDGFLNNL